MTVCCRVCGRRGHRFEIVTYLDAPDGGLPVHQYCVRRFFVALDAGWEPSTGPPTIKYKPEFRIVDGAGDGREEAGALGKVIEMDMSEFAGSRFLRVVDLKEQGGFKAKIVGVEKDKKFGKALLRLSEGSTLSLNVTNCQTLIRSFGADSDDWLNKEIELYIGRPTAIWTVRHPFE
jgi:hypothetical protein